MNDPVASVEPRVGTTQTRWIHFSSACLPQGMVSLSPDTRTDGDWGCGYAWSDKLIRGFSHIHDWQVAGLLTMPVVGEVTPVGGPDAFASEFSHEDEVCKPADHRLRLLRYGIEVELTASLRAGLHRWRFPRDREASILIDLASTLGPSEMGRAELRQLSAERYQGSVVNKPTYRRPKPLVVYFAIELDSPATLESFQNDQPAGVCQAIEGERLRARLRLGRVDRPVVMRVGISYTSCDAAWNNLLMETGGRSFDEVRDQARRLWNRQLSRIEVEGGTPAQRDRLYTDLFFALAGRRTCSDYAGTYIDNTGPQPVVRRIPLDAATGQPRYRHFNSDAFWGCQWSINLLWSLAYPELVDEFCSCFMDMCRNGGLIPRGPSGGNYTFVMTSAQTTPLFVSGILQGIYRPDDIEEVFQALHRNHMPGGLMGKCGYEHYTAIGGGIEDYIALGYIPEDLPRPPHGFHANGAGQTMEHSFNDWCLAQLASHLGRREEAELFRARSRNWRNLFDASIGFARPRLRSPSPDDPPRWMEPYSPDSGKGWTEAGGWTYTFYPAHDVQGLIEAFGSRQRMLARLEEAFALTEAAGFKAPHGKHEQTPLDFGNEPALATPFIFAQAGAPERTDHWVGRIMAALRAGNSPTDGFGGDEDQGIMGAWGVLTAIGLSSLDAACGLPPTFRLHKGLFDRVTVRRPWGPSVTTITLAQGRATLDPSPTDWTVRFDAPARHERGIGDEPGR